MMVVMKHTRLIILLVGLLMASANASAQSKTAYSADTAWVITSVDGSAKVRSLDASEIPATAGTILAEGMTVTTASASRLVLSHKGDSIVVSPGSAFRVGPETATPDQPSILQTLGTLLFSIDSSEGPRNFQVRTPYLAAVIKGTVFSVSVTPDGSALHVTEGLVQVASLATGQTGLVAVGQTARVAATGNRGLNIDRGDGKGSKQKEGNNSGKDDADKKDKAAAAGNQQSSPGNGQKNGQNNGQKNAKENGNRGNAALKIRNAIDVGIGNVAANTKGLLSSNVPGQSQNAGGGNAPGTNGNSVNARGPNLSKIITAQSNAGGNGNGNGNGNGGGNGGGNAGGNAGGNGGGNAGGNGGGNAGGNGGGNGGGNAGGNGGGNAGGNGGGNGNGNGNGGGNS